MKEGEKIKIPDCHHGNQVSTMLLMKKNVLSCLLFRLGTIDYPDESATLY